MLPDDLAVTEDTPEVKEPAKAAESVASGMQGTWASVMAAAAGGRKDEGKSYNPADEIDADEYEEIEEDEEFEDEEDAAEPAATAEEAVPAANSEVYEDYEDLDGDGEIDVRGTVIRDTVYDEALPDAWNETKNEPAVKGGSTETPVIVFDHVTKEYEDGPEDEDHAALRDVSFKINKGEFVFIVGPSGSGKSTLIRLLMREISPTEGSIFIAGINLAKLRNRQVCKYRRTIGIVFQDFRLLEDRTVYENIAFAQKVVGAPGRRISKNVAKMLALVNLQNKYKSYPNKLSGGEQQRVALARALVNGPLILLADEPTGNLDPGNTEEIMSLLEEINHRGTTVVVVTHNREIVDSMQKRVISLREGVVVDDKKGGYAGE